MELVKFKEEKIRSVGSFYLLNSSNSNASNKGNYDKSPKGSIDGPVYNLVDFLNSLEEFYTTSSCSGRISVYEHGISRKGINWLLVNHGTVTKDLIWDAIINKGIKQHINTNNNNKNNEYNENLLISFKCEPSIIHLCCHNLEGAKTLLHMVLACGFRESGITISGSGKIILAIRTNSDSLEFPILLKGCLLYKKETLALVVNEANQRLLHNFARLDKLLDMLKKKYCWPQLSLNIDDIQQKTPNSRWGHCSVSYSSSLSSSYQLLIGGQGFDNDGEYSRNLRPCISPINQKEDEEFVGTEWYKEYGMHIATCEWHSTLIILCGGRRSWNTKNKDKDNTNHDDFLRVYDTKTRRNVTTVIHLTPNNNTNQPKARWGHSLTRVNANSFLLFGGRNETGLVSDVAYLLTLKLQSLSNNNESDRNDRFEVVYEWSLLDSQCYADPTIDASIVVPAHGLQRFFHAACSLELELAGRSNYISSTTLPMDMPTYATTNTAEEDSGSDSILIFGGLNETSIGGLHSSAYPVALVYSGIRNRFECVELCNIDANACTDTYTTNGDCSELGRFGHTLTNIGYKTLALIGGTSFNPFVSSSDTIDNNNSNNGNTIGLLDYKFTNSGVLQFNYRQVSLPPSIAASSSASSINNDCRCHHTTTCVRSINRVKVANGAHMKRLYINGGGASFLSMGTHICCNLSIVLSLFNQSKYKDSSSSLVPTTAVKRSNQINADQNNTAMEQEWEQEQYNMLIPKKHVKAMKTYLEKQQWLHKAFRISRLEPSTLKYIQYLDLKGGVFIDKDSHIDNSSTQITMGEEDNAYGFQTNGYMALPLSSSFISKATAQIETFTEIELENLRVILQQEVDQIMISRQKNLRNKAESVSKFKKALQFIKYYIDTHSSSSSISMSMSSKMLNNLKFEIVGDILVIPEDKLVEEIFCTSTFWSQLAECFKLHRVARKALIDTGPMRESRVQLLYQDHHKNNKNIDSNNDSTGWTTVVENKIAFSFDITKVMFCSGNVTERTRAGQFAAKGQTIVDLYSGIGYYTVPFLVHAHAAVVHALEWNPNSVQALKINVEAARKSMNSSNNSNKLGECFIYQGDNRTTIEKNEHLWGCADRISLGLLPSSTEGWPLAVKCLKKEGGILHVHENVRDEEIDQWVNDACKTFTNLFLKQGQYMDITCLHIERVKSYSPRILHIVCDLKVEPSSE